MGPDLPRCADGEGVLFVNFRTRPWSVIGIGGLALLTLVPVELMGDLTDSPMLRAGAFLFLAAMVIGFLVIPWLRGGWMRRVRRNESTTGSSAFAVELSSDSGSVPTSRMVLVATCADLILIDVDGQRVSVAWEEISEITVIQTGPYARESIHIESEAGFGVVVLSRTTMAPVSPAKLATIVKELRILWLGILPDCSDDPRWP